MSAPGMIRAACLLAGKDLKLEGRTFEALSSMVLFSVIVLVLFSFAFELATVRELGVARLVPGVLWITFSFAGIVGFARSFQLEQRRDSLTALFLAPVDRAALFAGKALSNLATLTVLQAVVLPLSAVFFDFDLITVAGPLALVVALHSLGLAELGTLFGAMAVRLGRGEALLATLLLPVATPLLISAVQCTAAVLGGAALQSVRHWLLVSTGLDVLYFLIGLLTFEYVLEE